MKDAQTPAQKFGQAVLIVVIVAFSFIYLGERNGWDKHSFIRIPFISGPSKAQIRKALGEDSVEVLERFPNVTSDPQKDNAVRQGTTLYPIRVRMKDSAYEDQKAHTGWSDAQLRAANFTPFDT